MKVLCLTEFTEEYREKLEATEGFEFIYKSRNDDLSPFYDFIEIIIGNPKPEEVVGFRKLKWLQLDSAGNEPYLNIPENVTLTNASGAYGVAISEYMLACVLSSEKKLLEYSKKQEEKEYENLGRVNTVYGSTVLCLGLGDIGSNFAKRVKALGAHVISVTNTLHDKEEYVDESYTTEDLTKVLPRADIIACAMPHTTKTKGMLNYEVLSLAKKDAILVNVGRGSLIPTEDLLRVVAEGTFSSVYLDVFEKEPLPSDSPLYTAERIHITPHISGRQNAKVTVDLLTDIMVENLKRYKNGKELNNIVIRKRQY